MHPACIPRKFWLETLDFAFDIPFLPERMEATDPVGQVEFVNHGVGEVRFATEEGARQAVEQLDGTVLRGRTIVVVLDSKSPDNTKVKVIGLNPRIRFKPIKEHFSQAGEVSFVAAPGQAGKQR